MKNKTKVHLPYAPQLEKEKLGKALIPNGIGAFLLVFGRQKIAFRGSYGSVRKPGCNKQLQRNRQVRFLMSY